MRSPHSFSNHTSTPQIYTLSLHDALPIWVIPYLHRAGGVVWFEFPVICGWGRSQHDYLDLSKRFHTVIVRSEEHTSELQSHVNLVCRLLLEKKKKREKTSRGRRWWCGESR